MLFTILNNLVIILAAFSVTVILIYTVAAFVKYLTIKKQCESEAEIILSKKHLLNSIKTLISILIDFSLILYLLITRNYQDSEIFIIVFILYSISGLKNKSFLHSSNNEIHNKSKYEKYLKMNELAKKMNESFKK